MRNISKLSWYIEEIELDLVDTNYIYTSSWKRRNSRGETILDTIVGHIMGMCDSSYDV